MQTDISAALKRLLDERQHQVGAANAIDNTLTRIADLVSGGAGNGIVRPGRPRSTPPTNGDTSAGHVTTPVTLADHIEIVMKQRPKPIGIDDLMTGVHVSGYRSGSKNFRPVISLVLSQDRRFRRVRRGVYVLRHRIA